jgi:nitrogen-specific signal transduction histidine kinase
METYFAPAERTERRLFCNQVESISNSPIMSTLLKATGGLLVVLNEDRQIVGLNDAFLLALGISESASVLGMRLGETLDCIHAAENPHGCGTTPHCMTCGAAIATMGAINDNQVSEKTCALSAEKDGVALEMYLSIRAQPMKIDDSRWILIFAQDITHQHSLSTLEHIFFHDINNILTALLGSSDMLAREMPDQRRPQHILNAAKRLCAEVALQRFLSNQKDCSNLLNLSQVTISDIHEEVELLLYDHQNALNRKLEQKWPDEDITVRTDIHLISRVLGNMLLNALEATAEEGTVRLTTTVNDTDIMWEVWNDAYIPPEVQLRIFQKHFSTKASMGRGMGTHSMKLLGEKYLNGAVTFSSTLEAGTTFQFRHPLHS